MSSTCDCVGPNWFSYIRREELESMICCVFFSQSIAIWIIHSPMVGSSGILYGQIVHIVYICFLQNPLPAKPWEGILDATKDSQICIQIDPFTSGAPLTGSEDCLYLNVYAPHLVRTICFEFSRFETLNLTTNSNFIAWHEQNEFTCYGMDTWRRLSIWLWNPRALCARLSARSRHYISYS